MGGEAQEGITSIRLHQGLSDTRENIHSNREYGISLTHMVEGRPRLTFPDGCLLGRVDHWAAGSEVHGNLQMSDMPT